MSPKHNIKLPGNQDSYYNLMLLLIANCGLIKMLNRDGAILEISQLVNHVTYIPQIVSLGFDLHPSQMYVAYTWIGNLARN
jgi:hypothetical protein